MQFNKTYKTYAIALTTYKVEVIIALQNLIKATKNQAPNGFPVFADL